MTDELSVAVGEYEIRGVRRGLLPHWPPTVYGPHSLIRPLHDLLGDLLHEELWVLTVNNILQPRHLFKVAQGGVGSTAMLPVDVFRPIVLSGCLNFFLAHNHPSGVVTPSEEDLLHTKSVKEAAKVLGVNMLDHLIIGRDSVWSIERKEAYEV